ncbi:hypothetical protein K435DRAFT_618155, partial [Dendrothele bispora CBS 962.96]
PFVHRVGFEGVGGEVVWAKGFFDDGAMVAAMSAGVFDQVKHKLNGWGPSAKRLRMANNVVVPSIAHWKGIVVLEGIQVPGEFEVFDSGGAWEFLFGKPLLNAFRATHDYEADVIRI